MIGYDTETTGVDFETDRIVTAVVVHVVPGHDPVAWSWMADPGVEIPGSASEVHGITTEYAREHGRPPVEVLTEIRDTLHRLWRPGVPLVGHNVPFDLNITDREFGRHLDTSLPVLGPVVDTLAIDRKCWKYVRGKGMRRLVPACERYGLPELVNAHDAEADATAALRLAWAQSRRFPAEVGLMDLETLHARQGPWHREWATEFARYLEKQAVTLERGVRFGHPKVIASVLEEGMEPTPENIATTLEGLRARRDDLLAGADDWPLRPRPAVDEAA